MSKFKKGDSVRFNVKGRGYTAKAGATAIVTADQEVGRDSIQVRWLRDPLAGNQMDGSYEASDFDLITRPSKPSYDPSFFNPMTFTYRGVPAEQLDGYITVLDAHGIHTPKQLNDALGAASKPAPEVRVQVVDAGNEGRVLGSIPRPSMPAQGRMIAFTTMEPCRAYAPMPWERVETARVDMTLSRRVSKDGWTVEVVLSTTAPLDQLLKLSDFRLPGESRSQAEERRYRA